MSVSLLLVVATIKFYRLYASVTKLCLSLKLHVLAVLIVSILCRVLRGRVEPNVRYVHMYVVAPAQCYRWQASFVPREGDTS
jgi:hypothetical protein